MMGWILGGLFMLVAGGNIGAVICWLARQKHSSLVPAIGGIAGSGACFLLPYSSLHSWWWIPLLVDPGSAYLFVTTLLFIIRRR
jgi:hypothetical protein